MAFRTLAAPKALAALLASLTGCAFKFASSEPTGPEHATAGNAAFEQKNYATACQELSQAGPEAGAETLYRAGVACNKDGQNKAEKSLRAALSVKADYAPAMESLGLMAAAAGDTQKARELLEAAAKAGGKDPRAARALGEVYLLSGQCDKALAAFQEASRRDAGASQSKSRLEAARSLCAAHATAVTPAVRSMPQGGTPGGPASSGSGLPTGTSQPATPKDSGKTKAAPKTIDLNDI